MKNSEKYWEEREEKARKKHIKDEEEYRKKINSIYRQMRNEISDQIYAFYAKYSSDKGLNISEAKKKCETLDIEEFAKKAKKYVKEKDFSEQANDEMKLYNLTMKVNRLELLKAQLGLELCAGTDEIEKFMEKELEGRTLEELERQAGILGESLVDNKRLVHSIVNASFYNATFSDRIWANQDYLKLALDKILKTALIQGRNPREFVSEITKRFDVSSKEAYRLLVTELARVQTDAQMKSFQKNGFKQYTFHALGTACEYCRVIDGKHFNVKDAVSGKNMPPMHPYCRCSTSAYMDDEMYEEWIDGYKKHGLTWEEWKKNKNGVDTKDSCKIYSLGKLNRNIYKCITDDMITDEVIVTEKQMQHILDRHPEAYKEAISYLSDVVRNPDFIIQDKNKNTGLVIKKGKFGEHSQMVLRICTSSDNPDYKNSVISFWKINDKRLKVYLKNKKILYKK